MPSAHASSVLSAPMRTQPASAAVKRQTAPLSDRSRQLLAFGRTIGAKGRSVENPEALSAFFEHLDLLAAHRTTEPLKIITLGNSLISADNVTDVVRERLVERFGDAGRGLVMVDRFANYGPRSRTGYVRPDTWKAFNFAIGEKGRNVFGLAGVLHEATPGGYTEWRLKGETVAELFWLDRKDGADFDLKADNELLLHVQSAKVDEPKRLGFKIPSGTKKLILSAPKGRVSIFSLSLEKESPGVVLDTVGIPGAEASTYLTVQEPLQADHVMARKPRLVMFMLGGNEIRRLAFTRAAKVEARKAALAKDLVEVIGRMQKAAPDAACLVVGPIDAVYNNPDSPMKLKTRPQTDEINELERKVAQDRGCAFFDLYAAMGGKGSLAKFHAHDMLQDDLVHPKGRGFDLLGELMADAILKAYVESEPTQIAVRAP